MIPEISSESNSVVECHFPKVKVAGSNPVSRSLFLPKNRRNRKEPTYRRDRWVLCGVVGEGADEADRGRRESALRLWECPYSRLHHGIPTPHKPCQHTVV